MFRGEKLISSPYYCPTQLRAYRSYGEVKINRFITCPQCGKVNHNLRQYFNEKGEYIPEIY
jgi:hypothetical protein